MTKVEPSPIGSTSSLAPELAGAPLHSMDAIMSLRVCGTAHELKLPLSRSFVLGSGPEADVRVPASVTGRTVSRAHARLTRVGDDDVSGLLVEDLESTNGTSFDGVKRAVFVANAGQRFKVAQVELMVMDKVLAGLRHSLGAFFGFADHHRLDHDIVSLRYTPLLIVGARGSERGQLAADLHRYSPRRHRPFKEIADPVAGRARIERVFEAARGGTVYASLDPLDHRAPLASLIAMLLDCARDVWPILVARSWEHASEVLNNAAGLFRLLSIPALHTRGQEVPALLDLMLEEQGSRHRVGALPVDRIKALAKYGWPRNRIELRQTATRVAALIEHKGNLTAAAASITEDYDTFRDALLRVGAVAVRPRGKGA